jgi:hypothetical protein
VKLANPQTGVSDSAETDDNGIYRFLTVPVGKYQVTTQASGFKTVTTGEFTVAVEARQRVDIRLEVGDATATVTVNDAAAALETDSTNRGQDIQHDAIVDLPLNGRAYADLALLAPGVRHAISLTGRDASYNVNGMRAAFNNYIMDGIDNNAYGTSNQGFSFQVVQAAPDAVQEFRLDTNNYSAEYGHAAGAVINASIRSDQPVPRLCLGIPAQHRAQRNGFLSAGRRAEADLGSEPIRCRVGRPNSKRQAILLRRLRRVAQCCPNPDFLYLAHIGSKARQVGNPGR